jgi:hypothetical protein
MILGAVAIRAILPWERNVKLLHKVVTLLVVAYHRENLLRGECLGGEQDVS